MDDALVYWSARARDSPPMRSFAGWFYTILRHICTDILRRRNRRARQVEELARELPAVETVSPVKSSTAVAELLRPLPPEDREILVLRVVEMLSFSEIAARLGCSEEAAKKRAQRALRLLRGYTDMQS